MIHFLPPWPLVLALGSLAVATPRLVISAELVGPLSVKTPFRKAAIAQLFPGLRVRQTSDGYEDSLWPTVSVLRGDEEILQITGCDSAGNVCGVSSQGDPKRLQNNDCDSTSNVCRITVRGQEAVTADGVHAGDTYEKLLAERKITECSAGLEQDSCKAICRSNAIRNLVFVFTTSSKCQFESERLPPAKDLYPYRLTEIRWSASKVSPASR
jgi:hypothetical protein